MPDYPDTWDDSSSGPFNSGTGKPGGKGLYKQPGDGYPEGWNDGAGAQGRGLFGAGGGSGQRQRPWYDQGATTGQYRSDMMGHSGAVGAFADKQQRQPYAGSTALKQGLQRAEAVNMAQATARGADPSTGRAATYASDQMQAQGTQAGKAMDLQEQMARDQLSLQAAQQQVGHEQMMRDDATRRYLGGLGLAGVTDTMNTDENIADQAFASQITGTVLSGVGGLLSDERTKTVVAGNRQPGVSGISPYGYLGDPATNYTADITPYGHYKTTGPDTAWSQATDYVAPSAGSAEPDTISWSEKEDSKANAAKQPNKKTAKGTETTGQQASRRIGAGLSAAGAELKSTDLVGASAGGASPSKVSDAGVSALSQQLDAEATKPFLAPPPVTPEHHADPWANPYAQDYSQAPSPPVAGEPVYTDPQVIDLSQQLDAAPPPPGLASSDKHSKNIIAEQKKTISNQSAALQALADANFGKTEATERDIKGAVARQLGKQTGGHARKLGTNAGHAAKLSGAGYAAKHYPGSLSRPELKPMGKRPGVIMVRESKPIVARAGYPPLESLGAVDRASATETFTAVPDEPYGWNMESYHGDSLGYPELAVLSDARAKKLEAENEVLKSMMSAKGEVKHAGTKYANKSAKEYFVDEQLSPKVWRAKDAYYSRPGRQWGPKYIGPKRTQMHKIPAVKTGVSSLPAPKYIAAPQFNMEQQWNDEHGDAWTFGTHLEQLDQVPSATKRNGEG